MKITKKSKTKKFPKKTKKEIEKKKKSLKKSKAYRRYVPKGLSEKDTTVKSSRLSELFPDKSFNIFSLIKDVCSSDFIKPEAEDSGVLFFIGDIYTELMCAGMEPLNE